MKQSKKSRAKNEWKKWGKRNEMGEKNRTKGTGEQNEMIKKG
jgi:hypothetical protein